MKIFFKILGRNLIDYLKLGTLGILLLSVITIFLGILTFLLIIGIPGGIIYLLRLVGIENSYITLGTPFIWYAILWGIVKAYESFSTIKDYLLSVLYTTTLVSISLLESFMLISNLPYKEESIVFIMIFIIFSSINVLIYHICYTSYNEYLVYKKSSKL